MTEHIRVREAAPAMLAVLRELIDNRHRDYLHDDDRTMIADIIAKVEGRS